MNDGRYSQNGKVVIVPCSGIGKTYGTVSREAAYEVVEALRPETSQLVALSLLVLGDEAGLVASRRDRIDGRWIYYSVDREAAARWQQWFSQFLDPARIRERTVCGPEGQLVELDQITLSIAADGVD